MKIEWEYDLAEKPFCEQLKLMGWQWLEGDTDVPYLTERENFREVLLKSRLAAALQKLNLRDGQAWLDDARIGANCFRCSTPRMREWSGSFIRTSF